MKKLSRKNLRSLLMVTAVIVLLAGITSGCSRNGGVDETVNNLPTITDPTNAPTPTVAPTEEPTDPPYVAMGTVTTDNLNIRSSPSSTDSTIITQLNTNDRVGIIEMKTIDGINWGRIDQGWVNLSYVLIDGQTAPEPTQATETTPVVTDAPKTDNTTTTSQSGTVTTDSLNIRKGAGSSYESVGKYNKGDKITILETKNGWGRTDKGWVSMSYVQLSSTTDKTDKTDSTDKTTSSEVVTDGKTTVLGYGIVEDISTLNVRCGPGTNYDKVATITSGQRLAYFQKSGNWVRISSGWVSMTYFDINEKIESGTTGKVNTSELNIRKGAGSSYDKVGTYNKGDKITILEVKNNWGRTDKGWVSLNYVLLDVESTSSDKIQSDGKTDVLGYGIVEEVSSLNVRTGPGSDYDKVGTLSAGQRLPYYQKSGSWVRVSTGWVSTKYFNTEKTIASGTKGTVTSDTLKIREGAGTKYSEVGNYKKGDTVTILEVKNNWGKTDKGWISLNHVSFSTGITSGSTSTTKIESDGNTKVLSYGVVVSESLNLRAGPGTDKADIGNMKQGERAAVYQTDGKWVRTKNGWVSTSYFYIEGNKGTGAGTGTVTGSELNVRKGPGTSYDSVAKLKKGDKVEILNQLTIGKSTWGYTKDGWVSMSYVKMA